MRLVIDNLSVGYGHYPVTFGVSVEVAPGEVIALLGPNGAGKSSTLLGASGLAHVFSGTVILDGMSLDSVAGYKRSRLGLVHVPEDRSLFFDLTVSQNLRLASAMDAPGVSLDVFPELRGLSKRRAGLLSGGEQQMLAIARALEMRPRYLMIDEMSLGLAPAIARRLITGLHELVREKSIGLLLVEQNVEIAFDVADRVHVIAGGRIRYTGDATEARDDWPSFREAYFS